MAILNWEEIHNALIDQTGDDARIHTTAKGTNYIYTCPFCGKQGHFTVNWDKEVYNCYRCGGDDPEGRGSTYQLAEILGVTVETDEDANLLKPGGVNADSLQQELAELSKIADTPETRASVYELAEQPISPPPGFALIQPDNWRSYWGAVSYLFSRGLDWQQILCYRLGIALGGEKLVVTDWNASNQLRWWQMRTPVDSHTGPKYLGPDGYRGGKVGNWHRALAMATPYVGVAEGAISAIIAGYEFTWLWGKEFSLEQVDVLASARKLVVIALDGEAKAYKQSVDLATQLRSRGAQALIIPMPGDHDPASLGAGPFRELLNKTLARRDQSDLDFLERVVREYV